jgi:hypothetical protein
VKDSSSDAKASSKLSIISILVTEANCCWVIVAAWVSLDVNISENSLPFIHLLRSEDPPSQI